MGNGSKLTKLKWLMERANKETLSYALRVICAEGPINFIKMLRANLGWKYVASSGFEPLILDVNNLEEAGAGTVLNVQKEASFTVLPPNLGVNRIDVFTQNPGGGSISLKIEDHLGNTLLEHPPKAAKHNAYTSFSFEPLHNVRPPYYEPEPIVIRLFSDTDGCGCVEGRGGFSYRLYASSEPYIRWLERHTPGIERLKAQREEKFAYEPLISIVTPLFNTPKNYLEDMLSSVLAQTYKNWELCLVDAGDSHEEIEKTVKKINDSRIRLKRLGENRGISNNTNAAIAMTRGDYIAFLDHDDILAPHALHSYVSLLNARPDCELFYSDEDKVEDDGKTRTFPFFKPVWSPDTLLSFNYVTHFLMIKKTLLNEIGLLDEKYDGAQDHDLILRASERAKRIGHVSDILYHWRKSNRSASSAAAAKPNTTAAAVDAVQTALLRRGTAATASHGPYPNTTNIDYALPEKQPLVSVIIPNCNQLKTLKKCIESVINKTAYKNYEIIIIENNSSQKSLFKYYKKLATDLGVRVLTQNGRFNYSALNNFAASQAKGELLLFLNNDIEVITPEWMDVLAAHALLPGIGAVGAKLLYPDGLVQHGGVTLRVGGVAAHTHRFFSSSQPGYFNRLALTYNVGAVTGACMMVKKSIFFEVGALNERFSVAFNDVDFCVRLLNAGYRNLFVPRAMLYHYESKSRGHDNTPEKAARFKEECDLWLELWGEQYPYDPYYSRHLSPVTLDFAVNAGETLPAKFFERA